MEERGRRALALVLVLALLGSLMLRVAAAQAGSLRLTMQDDTTVVPGGTVTLYQVGEPDAANTSYTLTQAFAASAAVLPRSDLQDMSGTTALAAQLAEYAAAQGVAGRTVTVDTAGTAEFDQMEEGLYLLVQTTAPEGYTTLQPFLVEMPTLQSDGWLYDLQSYPKLERAAEKNEDNGLPWWIPLLGAGLLPIIGGLTDRAEEGGVTQEAGEGVLPTEPEEEGEGSVEEEAQLATLPQTGQLNWPVPILAASGLGLVLVGAWLRRRKDEE